MTHKNSIQNAFISLVERVANGRVKVLDFGEDMVFYRGEILLIKQIGDQEGIYASQLADNMGVTRAVVHKTLKKLEIRGLVQKKSHPVDQKKKQLFLTDKGREAYELHEKYHHENDHDFMDFLFSLDEKEAKIIEEFLFHANEMVKKQY